MGEWGEIWKKARGETAKQMEPAPENRDQLRSSETGQATRIQTPEEIEQEIADAKAKAAEHMDQINQKQATHQMALDAARDAWAAKNMGALDDKVRRSLEKQAASEQRLRDVAKDAASALKDIKRNE